MKTIPTPILFTVRIMIGTIVTALVVVPLFLFSVFALLLDYLVSRTRRLKRVLVSAKDMRTVNASARRQVSQFAI